MKYLISNKNKFKANLGSFSTVSKGNLTPEQIKAIYMEKGYFIVAFSDDDSVTTQKHLTDDNFLPIAAYRVSIDNYNFVLYAKNEESIDTVEIPQCSDIKKKVNEFIHNAKEKGYLVCIAHPAKSMQTFSDYDGVSGYFALEISDYSSMIDGHLEDNNHIYDRVLRYSQNAVYPLAFDSNTNFYPFEDAKNDSFGAFTVIYADRLDYENIISSLQNGEFYCSTGPTFEEIYVDGSKIHIKCSPVRSIRLLNEGRDAPIAIAQDGELITEAKFDIDSDAFGRFVRVDIRDKFGNFADTVPYYIKDILED